jgi:hypothetical protein
MILLDEGEEKTRESVNADGQVVSEVLRKGMKPQQVESELARLASGKNVALRKMLRWKIRYFTDGAVLGSRKFVDEFFARCPERFGPKRKNGARKMRGKAAGAGDALWSARDLRKGIV